MVLERQFVTDDVQQNVGSNEPYATGTFQMLTIFDTPSEPATATLLVMTGKATSLVAPDFSDPGITATGIPVVFVA